MLCRCYIAFKYRKIALEVLELGLGCGSNLVTIPQSVVQSGVGIDISHEACQYAESRDSLNRFKFITHDITSFPYPFKNKSFDLILDRSSLSFFNKSTIIAILNKIDQTISRPYYIYSNLYSDEHSSRPSRGDSVSHGATCGTLNASTVYYYSRNDILEIFGKKIMNIQLEKIIDYTSDSFTQQAEWRILSYVE